MSQASRNRNVHPLRALLLAAALGLVAVGLSQCRLASQSITGVDAGAGRLSGKSLCVKSCNDAYESAVRAEADRYKDAVKACGKDRDCRNKAKSDHDATLERLQQARKDCKRGCYNEGGGQTGA